MVSLNYDKKRVIKLNNKTRNIIASLYVISLFVLLVGTTFSFFTTKTQIASLSPKVEATTATRNQTIFETIGSIGIYPNATNFKLGEDSLSSTVNANVYFTHSKTDPVTSDKYDIVLNITENNFEYSTLDKTPELVLTLISPNGEVKYVGGLDYKTITDNKGNTISGFDITALDKPITIANNIEISTTNEETITQKWEIIITYVNLGVSQNLNYDKKLSGIIEVKRAE